MSNYELLNKLQKLFESGRLTRREFFRYAGIISGTLAAGSLLPGRRSKVLADTRPRVVSVHDANATNWDFSTGYYWEHINQEVVNSMVAQGVMTLTGESTVGDAWSALIPYQSDEAVAIKVNFNNSWSCTDYDNAMDAYPETVNAVIDGLTLIGVPSEKIWVTDPSRIIPYRFINKIKDSSIKYFTSLLTCNYDKYYLTDYVDADSCDASPTTHPDDDVVRPAQVFIDAAHLINIPLFKGHGHGWYSLGLKNHYGSVTFKNYPHEDDGSERRRLHTYIIPNSNPDKEKSTLADISNNLHIREKTRLILGDGLFGHPLLYSAQPVLWSIFSGKSPNMLFFGIDPIATDSVMYDYISEEQNLRYGLSVVHSSLHYGNTLGLGVHDHWHDIKTKYYDLIDYVALDADNKRNLVDKIIKNYQDDIIELDDVLLEIEKYMQSS